jgi:hypothetical protein
MERLPAARGNPNFSGCVCVWNVRERSDGPQPETESRSWQWILQKMEAAGDGYKARQHSHKHRANMSYYSTWTDPAEGIMRG